MAETLLGEDPRVMATGPAHELKHAGSFDLVALALRPASGPELESGAFLARAIVARATWPYELLGGSDPERGLAMIAAAYEDGGSDELRVVVAATTGYAGERCDAEAVASTHDTGFPGAERVDAAPDWQGVGLVAVWEGGHRRTRRRSRSRSPAIRRRIVEIAPADVKPIATPRKSASATTVPPGTWAARA